MAEAERHVLTRASATRYEEELQHLKVVRRKEVAQKIKEARELGDLSENAEYDAAKDEQRTIEARIEELTTLLKNADIVDDEEIELDKVNVGCRVVLFDKELSETVEYRIVGFSEARSLRGMISNESPVGKALMGHRVGDVVSVETPVGAVLQFEILGILRTEE
ncbi:MAG: transcription elongation factor GreA [Lachnospiraceae bacterium]|nr:transcription elongation factor GreA [Lachnospiraceae bacterium]